MGGSPSVQTWSLSTHWRNSSEEQADIGKMNAFPLIEVPDLAFNPANPVEERNHCTMHVFHTQQDLQKALEGI